MYINKALMICVVLNKKAFKSILLWQVCCNCSKWTKSKGLLTSVAVAHDDKKRKATKAENNTLVAAPSAGRPIGNNKAKAQVLRKNCVAQRTTFQSTATAIATT